MIIICSSFRKAILNIQFNYSLILLLLLLSILGKSQSSDSLSRNIPKLPYNEDAFKTWETIRTPRLSNDGQYIAYGVSDGLLNYSQILKLVLIDKKNNRQYQINNVNKNQIIQFSENSKYFFFCIGKDSLIILNLQNMNQELLPNSSIIKVLSIDKEDELLLIQDNSSKSIVIYSTTVSKKLNLNNVVSYALSENNQVLALIEKLPNDDTTYVISKMNLKSKDRKNLYQGSLPLCLTLDQKGDKLAFLIQTAGLNKLFLIDSKKEKEIASADQEIKITTPPGHYLNGITEFSHNGNFLFLQFNRFLEPVRNSIPSLDVWHYKDAKIVSQQLAEMTSLGKIYQLNLFNKLLYELTNEVETSQQITHNLYLISESIGSESDWFWKMEDYPKYYIKNINTGERHKVDFPAEFFPEPSPTGKYILATNNGKIIISYEISSGKMADITSALNIPCCSSNLDRPIQKGSRSLKIAGWTLNDSSVLLYDEYDIWKIDPKGSVPAQCLTNFYGRKNKITLRLLEAGNPAITFNKSIILHAFNNTTKESGFYKLKIPSIENPKKLCMGAYFYSGLYENIMAKSRDNETYIITRQSSTESPKLYYTKDFITFERLSNNYPEKKYLSSIPKLVTYKCPNDLNESAIIYVPENFDSTKKYPVILTCYERQTDYLNVFQTPGGNMGSLDISWFCSRGYIIVAPDIHFTIGEPGKSALNSILGVINYLNDQAWIDKANIGIHGFSFGGFISNYAVTHCKIFKAAVSNAGLSNFVGGYNSLRGDNSAYFVYEKGQLRMGLPLWEIPDKYYENSPIFAVQNINAPILLFANKQDKNVPFSQGIEFFMALRRQNKPTWLIQYDGEGHGIGGTNYIDYLKRTTQFFDHFLKGAKAPVWLKNGIPSHLKGKEDGLELVN